MDKIDIVKVIYGRLLAEHTRTDETALCEMLEFEIEYGFSKKRCLRV